MNIKKSMKVIGISAFITGIALSLLYFIVTYQLGAERLQDMQQDLNAAGVYDARIFDAIENDRFVGDIEGINFPFTQELKTGLVNYWDGALIDIGAGLYQIQVHENVVFEACVSSDNNLTQMQLIFAEQVDFEDIQRCLVSYFLLLNRDMAENDLNTTAEQVWSFVHDLGQNADIFINEHIGFEVVCGNGYCLIRIP